MAFTIFASDEEILKYLGKRGLLKKYWKQVKLLSENPRHPSLNVELMEPKGEGVYSFRIDRKYRAIFVIIPEENAIKIFDTNDHYQ